MQSKEIGVRREMVACRVMGETKAVLLARAKEKDVTLSEYVASMLEKAVAGSKK